MLSIVGIAPHPPIIIPEIGRGQMRAAANTVDGVKQLSSRIREKQPELIIMITPHGQVVRKGPAVLAGTKLAGDFGQFGFPGLKVEMETDRELVDLLVEETANLPVKPVLLGDHDQQPRSGKTLDHGAMVPLYYLREAGISVPGLHITVSFDPYSDLYRFGQALRKAVDKRGAPTAVIASGDLSHRLKPGAPAGYSPRGKDFDQLLVDLISAGRVDDILNIDQRLIEEAGECGLRPIIMALGLLEESGFNPEILSYEGPFGVGYLVAALHPRDQKSAGAEKGGSV